MSMSISIRGRIFCYSAAVRSDEPSWNGRQTSRRARLASARAEAPTARFAESRVSEIVNQILIGPSQLVAECSSLLAGCNLVILRIDRRDGGNYGAKRGGKIRSQMVRNAYVTEPTYAPPRLSASQSRETF